MSDCGDLYRAACPEAKTGQNDMAARWTLAGTSHKEDLANGIEQRNRWMNRSPWRA